MRRVLGAELRAPWWFGADLADAIGEGVEAEVGYAWMNILLLAGRQGFDVATVRFVADYRSRAEWGLLRGYLRFSRTLVAAASVAVAAAMALEHIRIGSGHIRRA